MMVKRPSGCAERRTTSSAPSTSTLRNKAPSSRPLRCSNSESEAHGTFSNPWSRPCRCADMVKSRCAACGPPAREKMTVALAPPPSHTAECSKRERLRPLCTSPSSRGTSRVAAYSRVKRHRGRPAQQRCPGVRGPHGAAMARVACPQRAAQPHAVGCIDHMSLVCRAGISPELPAQQHAGPPTSVLQ
eukprot:2568047-Prymnesium_polylepis.1